MIATTDQSMVVGEALSVDVPGILLSDEMDRQICGRIVATEDGVLAGCEDMAVHANELGLMIELHFVSGQEVSTGMTIATCSGNPLQLIKAEDLLLGRLSKFSGVATAARYAQRAARGFEVVCGGWKKMPLELKIGLREALVAGGVGIRILNEPFVYLDKNYVRIFGSVAAALKAADRLPDRAPVLQVRGETAPVFNEALEAAELGACVIMVDTGNIEDLRKVARELRAAGKRGAVKLAFAGGITLKDLSRLADEDIDLVDLGRAIIDAPLLDFRYEIMP